MRIAKILAALLLTFMAGWWSRGMSADAPPNRSPPAAVYDEPGAARPVLEGRAKEAIESQDPTVGSATPVSTCSNDPGTSPTHGPGSLVEDTGGDGTPPTRLQTAENLVRRIRPLLARGRAAPLDLWRCLESVAESEPWEWLYSGSEDSAAARHVWERFVAAHEDEVAGFLEAAYALMLATHLDPEDVSLAGLEVLAPTRGADLIAALPPDRMRATRDVLRRLVNDGETLPEEDRHAIRAALERVLAAWARSVSPAEARLQLGRGKATVREMLALFERIPIQEVGRYDPAAPIVRLLDGEGDWDAFLRSLHWLRDARGIIAPATIERLDEAAISATKRSGYTDHPKRLRDYLDRTSRSGWPAAEDFLEAALDAGDRALTHAPLTLLLLKPKPPKHYLQAVLDRYEVPMHVRAALESAVAR